MKMKYITLIKNYVLTVFKTTCSLNTKTYLSYIKIKKNKKTR